MGYTMSFDASTKCGLGDIRGLLEHVGRDVDKANGREVRHSNQDIDPSRTAKNITLVSQGKGLQPCYDTREIVDAVTRRLCDVKKPLRKDAVALRPLILQLDPEWYEAHQDPEEREKAMCDMIMWSYQTFGQKNIMYAAMHLDETNPHLHIGFCPVTEDGRLSQKDWFSSPGKLREMHQDLREYMREQGYDIELERKKPGKYAKRMSVSEYKDFQELQKEREALDADRRALEADRKALERERAGIRQAVETALRACQEAQETLSECQEYKRTIAEQQQARKLAARSQQTAARAAQAAELLNGMTGGDSRERSL